MKYVTLLSTLLIAIAMCNNTTSTCDNPLLEKANNPNLPEGIKKLTTPIDLTKIANTSLTQCKKLSASCCSVADINKFA